MSSVASLTRTITHSASGASCTIHNLGATVLSFKTSTGRECLFLSRDAVLDGSKAIRGGIPLVFPQFGQPDPSMPQHGFLRANLWNVDESTIKDDAEGGASITYTLALKDAVNARGGKWDSSTLFDCICKYTIHVHAKKLTTTLEIHNTSTSCAEETSFAFQTLQHTYFMVENHTAMDPSQCFVTGLHGYTVSDKVTKEPDYVLGDDPVTIADVNVDRVYTPPAEQDTVNVTIGVGASFKIQMVAMGSVDGLSVPVSCVVWNPYKEKAAEMSDFGNDQYVDMICVEPGILGNPVLQAGKVATLTQIIELLED